MVKARSNQLQPNGPIIKSNPGQMLPQNWPSDIPYLTEHTYSQTVTAEVQTQLHAESAASASLAKIPLASAKAPHPLVKIRAISDDQHPAHGQRGLFAAQDLEPDAFLLPYQGHVHISSMSDTDPHSDYDLSLDRELGISVDAARSGNEARFTNDYRGIAERANAEFRDCFVEVEHQGRELLPKWERRVGIFVLSAGKAGKRKGGITAGEEILVSYGKGFWEARKALATFRKDDQMLRNADAALRA